MTELPATPSLRLDGRRALVAGASTGIGLGAAVALAEAGAHVVCLARRPEPLTRAVDAMRTKGFPAEGQPLDIADTEAVGQWLREQPAFDVVVNSAGTARHSPATKTRPEDFDAVMGVNLRAAYFLSARTAQTMQETGTRGSIIHISSQMGHVGGPDRAVYAASKHGLEGMVKSMAIEFGPSGIRINTICPTFVRTPLTRPTFDDPERRAWIDSKIKLDRVAEVRDIMGAVAFLASDAAAMITGTALLIDGGWTAG